MKRARTRHDGCLAWYLANVQPELYFDLRFYASKARLVLFKPLLESEEVVNLITELRIGFYIQQKHYQRILDRHGEQAAFDAIMEIPIQLFVATPRGVSGS
jgi:hypothetical protein